MDATDESACCAGCGNASALAVPVICLVVGVEVASVAVALFGYVPWLSTSEANICCMLSSCSFSSLLVVVVPFAFSFVAVPLSFVKLLLSFERVSLSNRFLIVFAVVVPLCLRPLQLL